MELYFSLSATRSNVSVLIMIYDSSCVQAGSRVDHNAQVREKSDPTLTRVTQTNGKYFRKKMEFDRTLMISLP